MTKPGKDNVVDPSDNVNAGTGSPSSPSGSKANGAVDPSGSAAQAKKIPISGDEGSATSQSNSAGKPPKGGAAPAGAKQASKSQKAATAQDDSAKDETLEPDIVEEAEAVLNDANIASDSEVVAQAKAEVAEWKDKYMRLHAEWDTYRRRTNEQRAEERVRAAEKLVESLIPVIDDFERTIEYAQNNGETGLLGGVEAVHNKLINVLEKDGVQVINPEGQAFDALESQAVGTVDDPSQPDETVAQVYQKGYRLGTKVLRPAMVTVTVGGPKREPEETEK